MISIFPLKEPRFFRKYLSGWNTAASSKYERFTAFLSALRGIARRA
jgi:hypothetical protein